MSHQADTVIALAGIMQATNLVNEIARHNRIDNHHFTTCINSIFCTDPTSTEDVFGGVDQLEKGLELIIMQLGQKENPEKIDATKYAIGIIHLQKKLSKNQAMLNEISAGIDKARIQSTHFNPEHPNVIASLADTYKKTISTLSPQIMVNGEHGYLSAADNANKIRAILLAAMRSAVLWRQNGGSQLKLIFGRKKVVKTAEHLLSTTT